MKKIVIALVAIIAVVALGVKGKGLLDSRKSEVANEALPEVSKVSVPVVDAKQGELQERKRYLATIASDKSIALSTKLAGFVEKVYVEESQPVSKGDLLVKIDAVELRSNMDAIQATIAAQKSDLSLARSIVSRNQKLFNVGGLSREKLDISRVSLKAKSSQIENSQQKLAQLQHQLSYLTIKAPFDGVVDSIMLREGDLAATGKPILRMSNGDKKLLFSFSPSQAIMIKKGASVHVDKEEIGKVKTIYTTSKNGLITAEVALEKALTLPVGSSLNVDVIIANKRGCILPSNSILHKKDGDFVMLYQQGKFTPQKVTISLSSENEVLVESCPKLPVAQASEVKLAKLPAYKNVHIIGASHE
jgi:RND family efflux transporter MFP subunit